MTFLVDVHAHLDMLDAAPEETCQLAQAAGVEHIITIGSEPNDFAKTLQIAEQLYPKVYCTLGVHPHRAEAWSEMVRQYIVAHAAKPWVVAVGEIGLDYYYQNAKVSDQKKAFIEQLMLAQELNLPVQIHTRDAEGDTIDILQNFKNQVSGIVHCFTGTIELARKVLDFGFYISISGVVTFKNAENVRQVVRFLPLDRILVETDSPFLAPVPYRGKQNIPAYVTHVAMKIAEVKGLPIEHIIECSSANTLKVFSRMRRGS